MPVYIGAINSRYKKSCDKSSIMVKLYIKIIEKGVVWG